MWTPRRLVMMFVGAVVSVAAFWLYSAVLGRIDGLPALPAEFLVRRAADGAGPEFKANDTAIVQKFQQAFGPNCLEIGYKNKLELGNGILLATNEFSKTDDGRMKMWPFSIAVFKDRGPGQDKEIYTIHSDEAYILFEQPVNNLAEAGKRRIIGCDLNSDPGLLSPDPRRNRIICQHNRGTIDPDDDLVMETIGPVKYRELPQPPPPLESAPPQIQTSAVVHLLDKRGQPHSTVITSVGMQIFLAPQAKPQAAKSSPSGVRKILLPEQVTMDLWIDPQGGFLANGKPAAERSNVQITTPGPFTYRIGEESDTALFEMKPATAGKRPGYVQVVRPLIKDGKTVFDRLDSESLELQFAHKSPDANAKNDPGSNLQSVHAWGKYVVITSQGENLQAQGNDLFHDAALKQTTLKGTPEVVALKEGHEIHAPVIVMMGADEKNGQEVHALGKGWFRGLAATEGDANTAPRTLMARWNDRMHYRKDDGVEVLTLTGSAVFEDPVRKQTLAGEQIKLTLVPDANAKAAPGAPKVKPRRLEVTGRVAAHTPDLIIEDTDQLVVLFKDAPAKVAAPAPAVIPGVAAVPQTGSAAPTTALVGPPPPPEAAKPPLIVAARSVQASVWSHADGPTELDTVHCEGQVRVHQDPAPPQEKPIDMRGDALNLSRKGDGNVLEVAGDADRPAEVNFPDIAMAGPTVVIDQVDNDTKVIGPGAMKLVSTTDFQGNKLAKPTDLMVTWKREMYFNGTIANFLGDVHADQENTRLLCDTMQVTLDKKVDFNRQPGAAAPDDKAASVLKVVCWTNNEPASPPVIVADSLRENGVMTRYQRIESRELRVYKAEGKLEAPGPGEVRILQKGLKNVAGPIGPAPPAKASPAPGKAPAADEEELKLTYVRYDRMLNVFNNTRLAIFEGKVEVLHLPADDPALHLDLNKLIDKLPKRALYLKCDRLEIYTDDHGPQKSHLLKAINRASVQFDNVIGQADKISYDESKQLVTFEGSPGRPAVLNQMQGVGQAPKKFTGDKFHYNRATGRFDGSDVISFSD